MRNTVKRKINTIPCNLDVCYLTQYRDDDINLDLNVNSSCSSRTLQI